ncbi:MAG: putative molybdenum carrier protein [Candidatus Thiodiazotropha sp. (ex Codakia orbicularis)]|nr:putative molybdenum carrier protein [Candidatus Thiodiazotropha sp. (ex Codakia orbicularis)]MBT3044453.1 putative molybdenum carrier protein [Candidatus Thiodiazotropha sp. (ex Codakia orbicularis)]MBT3056238.1 putative molybdenum carrier protein [Candidatus Thiodiazotropha sp. (ex Codakia orbicularis)]
MLKIVSGAQTGVDRAALDAAMAYGVEAGGWCPHGRLAEDGVIPECYPVTELANAGYTERTLQNVIDSDATLIIYFGYLSGGTEQTLAFCIAQRKPYLLIDAEELNRPRAAQRIQQFIADKGIAILNVAGPRASGEASAYDYARTILESVLRTLCINPSDRC